MASRTVKSAAGEQIEIVPDEEWVATTGGEMKGLRQWTGQKGMKPKIIRALWEHGEFTSPNGLASNQVMAWIVENVRGKGVGGRTTIMNVWRGPLNAPTVETTTKGKRTYSIKLVALPETWYGKLLKDIEAQPIRNGDTTQEPPEPVDEAPPAALQAALDKPESLEELDQATWSDDDWESLKLDAPTVYEEPPPLEFQVANQVAMSLLTTVVEIISSGKVDTLGQQRLQGELEAMQQTLSVRLDDLNRLRKQLREAADMVNALKLERDGLRTRLRQTEHNLNEALKGETAQAVNAEIQKRVDAIMRQPPTSPKGD